MAKTVRFPTAFPQRLSRTAMGTNLPVPEPGLCYTFGVMRRREFMGLLGGGMALAAMPGWAGSSADSRPNIVLFLVDDMGWQDTGLPFWYPNGGATPRRTPLNARYRTPNMERMAREGAMFTAAYAQPVCSPTRVSVLSGMNAARHRVTSWTSRVDGRPVASVNGYREAAWAVNGLQPPTCEASSEAGGVARAAYEAPTGARPPERPWAMRAPYVRGKTLPMFLREAGYATVLAGKAHFAAGNGFGPKAAFTPGQNPEALGFDVSLCGSHRGQPSNYRPDKGAHYGGEIFGLEKAQAEGRFLTDALTREAIAAAEAAQARVPGQPFFLYLGHFALHLPCDNAHAYDASRAADPDVLRDTENPNPNDGLPWNAIERNYRNLIAGMDESLGRVLDWARGLKTRTGRDTLVVLMGDNGGLVGRDQRAPMGPLEGNAPLRHGKGSCYEGGIREPFLAWLPGHIPAGLVEHTPIVCEDLFPTFLDYAGLAPEAWGRGLAETPARLFPEGEGGIVQALDGVSLRGAFEGGRPPERTRPILIHHPNVWWGAGADPKAYDLFTALRVGDWKLIWHHDLGTLELFNLANDLSERNDQSEARPALTAKLARTMGELLRARGAQRPTRGGVPVPWPDAR